jgi:hypothetical protein
MLLKIFLAMAIIPEVLFCFLTSFVLFFLHKNIVFPMQGILGEDYFLDHQGALFTGLTIEILGLLGLLIWNIKFNVKRFKILISFLLLVLFLLGVFFLYTAFYMRNGIGF